MDYEKLAKQTWAERFEANADEACLIDVAEWYPWSETHRVMLALDEERGRRLYMAIAADGEVLAFGDANDLSAFNRYWEVVGAALPDGLPALHFADTLRQFLGSTRAKIGSPEQLDDAGEPKLRGWFKSDGGVALFKKYCSEPLVEDDGTRWQMSFFAFNDEGAVESWRVSGSPERIEKAEMSLVEPAGTFHFPYV